MRLRNKLIPFGPACSTWDLVIRRVKPMPLSNLVKRLRPSKITVIVATLAATVFLSLIVLTPIVSASPDWYNSSWLYCKPVTIDHAKVDANLDNFPVLIVTTLEDAKAQDDGDDILFTENDGTTKLDHEIESFDTESLIAWVRIPSLSGTENTTIYIYYGNSGASNQENIEGVWDGDFEAVWHMDDNSTSTILDSTSNAHHGDKYQADQPNELTGKIGMGQNCDGTNDYIDTNYGPNFSATDNWTIELWGKMADESAETQLFGAAAETGATDAVIILSQRGNEDDNFRPYFRTNANYRKWCYGTSIGDDVWHHLVAIKTGDGVVVYIDGVDQGAYGEAGGSGWSGTWDLSSVSFYIGANNIKGSASNWADGVLDEVRFSTIIRDENWISTSYNNQNSPNTFYSVGSEESLPPTEPQRDKPIENRPYFEWSGTGADNYRLLVDNDSDFGSPILFSVQYSFYSDTADGDLARKYESTYSSAHDPENAETITDSGVTFTVGQATPPGYSIYRGFLFFDTSGVPSSVEITDAEISFVISVNSTITNFEMIVQNGQLGYPHKPLEKSDYLFSRYSDNGGSIYVNGLTTHTRYRIELNETGKGWIDTESWTKLCLRSDRDIDNIAQSYDELIAIYAREQTGANYDPILSIITNENSRFTTENYYQFTENESLENGVYYWKVIAYNTAGENESDTWTFIVGTVAENADGVSYQEEAEVFAVFFCFIFVLLLGLVIRRRAEGQTE